MELGFFPPHKAKQGSAAAPTELIFRARGGDREDSGSGAGNAQGAPD